ncbi:MAG: DNA-processing protein DprA [Lachnospiraceae bacterium]|nr:DNA-processing protein DprA [Lachnospiraceae bacterium]
MIYSDNSMSTILLCSHLGLNRTDNFKPFTLREWYQFLDELAALNEEPSCVLSNPQTLSGKPFCSEEQLHRIAMLAGRSVKVALELEALEKKGIYAVTTYDSDYPILMKRKLGKKTPPVLFYAGNLELARKIGIAVVGSRNIDEEGMDFARKLARKASEEKLVIYSGGARGVDSISESAALHSGGAAVTFLADSLTQRLKNNDILDPLLNNKLLLISDVHPDSGFSPGRAMNRNKYIYASSYGAFIVRSDVNSGGTWAGAAESLKHHYTKTFIWDKPGYDGNRKLIENGGIPFRLSQESIFNIITQKSIDTVPSKGKNNPEQDLYVQQDLFHYFTAPDTERTTASVQKYDALNKPAGTVRAAAIPVSQPCAAPSENTAAETEMADMDIYDLVRDLLIDYASEGRKEKEMAEHFHIKQGQMREWLQRLCQDGFLKVERHIYTQNRASSQ